MAMGRLSNRLTAPRSGAGWPWTWHPGTRFTTGVMRSWPRPSSTKPSRCCASRTTVPAALLCQPHYKDGVGRPSIPPGRYFRMLFVGQFEGLDSEREIAWRCADSLSLHRFLRLSDGETVPDHSTLSVTRSRLPLEIHHAVFGFLLEIANKHDLVRVKRIGVDASTQEANAALRRLVRRDTGEDYQEMLRRLARESGIETPSAEDLIRFDRARKNKTLSNADWVSPTDPAARIARMKDGTTHLAYKPEHAVDLDTGVIVAIHPADQGDPRPLAATLEQAEAMLDLVGLAPTPEDPAEMVADKGYHSREGLKALEDSAWKSRISEQEQKAFARWHGDDAARRAGYNNRAQLKRPARLSSCAPKRSSAVSPSSSTSAACAAPGCAVPGTSKSAT